MAAWLKSIRVLLNVHNQVDGNVVIDYNASQRFGGLFAQLFGERL